MTMKGSDEELPLSMVEENAQEVGSSFFSRRNFGHYHEHFLFFKKKRSARCHHKRRGNFSMSEKDFISFSNTTRK